MKKNKFELGIPLIRSIDGFLNTEYGYICNINFFDTGQITYDVYWSKNENVVEHYFESEIKIYVENFEFYLKRFQEKTQL